MTGRQLLLVLPALTAEQLDKDLTVLVNDELYAVQRLIVTEKDGQNATDVLDPGSPVLVAGELPDAPGPLYTSPAVRQ